METTPAIASFHTKYIVVSGVFAKSDRATTVSEVPNRHVNHLGAEMLLLTHFVLLWGEK